MVLETKRKTTVKQFKRKQTKMGFKRRKAYRQIPLKKIRFIDYIFAFVILVERDKTFVT